jgi:hypothetical protein
MRLEVFLFQLLELLLVLVSRLGKRLLFLVLLVDRRFLFPQICFLVLLAQSLLGRFVNLSHGLIVFKLLLLIKRRFLFLKKVLVILQRLFGLTEPLLQQVDAVAVLFDLALNFGLGIDLLLFVERAQVELLFLGRLRTGCGALPRANRNETFLLGVGVQQAGFGQLVGLGWCGVYLEVRAVEHAAVPWGVLVHEVEVRGVHLGVGRTLGDKFRAVVGSQTHGAALRNGGDPQQQHDGLA